MKECQTSEEYWNDLYLCALGALNLPYEFEEKYTLGQLQDLIVAHNYKEWLENRKAAKQTLLLLSGIVDKTPTLDELCGIWDKNRVVKIDEYNKTALDNFVNNM